MNDFIKREKKYYCPFDCGDSRFPKPSWKTEKGAQKHVDNCYMRPEAVEARSDQDKERNNKEVKRLKEQAAADSERLNSAKFSIGNCIHFVHVVEVKPTHEQRGARMVKVRYEPVNDYSARSITVNDIKCNNGVIIYNGICNESSAFDTLNQAKESATVRQAGHLRGNKMASDFR